MENLNKDIMSYKDWLITLLITSIPVLGIIMIFVWAFDKNGNQSRANFCKAQLTFVAIVFVLTLISVFLFGGLLALIAGGM